MRLERFGLVVDLPPGWEGRIYRRAPHEPDATTHPILHAATFPLPEDRGDFGGGAVELMGGEDLFVALVEYHPEAAATPLFARTGVPALSAPAFHPGRLQRHLPGKSGAQIFFSHQGRAFCLYVVLGDHLRRSELAARVAHLLAALEIRREAG